MPEQQPLITKPCPECGWPLTLRENGKTGEKFLGCTKFPECTHTEPLTPYLKAKLSGYPTLF